MVNPDAGTSRGNAGGGQYQVFLNFHGQDTRDGFTDFLYQDLVENCIHVFMDDEELQVGEEIGGELLRAIDDSQIYIPIFSRNYANNKWCLRELARMVHNASQSEKKKILPIFYDVEPKDVDLKTPLYRKAIEKHKKERKEKFPGEGESWEDALKKVDKIKGWELKKCKSKAELMKLAVKEVLHRLKRKHKIVTGELVGLDDQVAEVLGLLDVNCSDEVRLLIIHGMGGIGKTTLAGVVYNKLSSCFGKCCAFLDNIRETSKKQDLVLLQKNLLTEIASSSSAQIIEGVDDGRERIEETLGNKKVLIVLDDVDEKEHIKNLIGQHRLHPGTRVIITTRSTSVLEFIEQRMAREMKEMNSDHALPILAYEMKEMNFDNALQLFKRHAFLDNSLAKDFDSLSKDIVFTTGGLPLAVEVIGSLLFRKPKAKWEITLNQLRKVPHKRVQEKLKISYDDLNNHQRKIFLDVACFFIDEDMMNANYMWEACGFDPTLEIDVLVEMSLIKIKDNKFWMDDQLRDFGREIVHQEKQSRLWTIEEYFDFEKTKERCEGVEALDLRGWGTYIKISHEVIGRFTNLRFLRLSNAYLHGDFLVCPPTLIWFSWHSPPRDVSVAIMHSKNLVVLELSNNDFTDDSKVWDMIKMATKLKKLTLVLCGGITRTPDLSKCLVLERLTFDKCESLKEIGKSIGMLKCLLDLNITDCGFVEHVPDEIGGLVKLECFSLKRCNKVCGLPTSIGDLPSLRKLDLSNTGITSLPDSIEKLRCLSDLCLKDTKIRQLPNFIEKLTSLRTLDLSKQVIDTFILMNPNIDRWELPKAIGILDKLEELCLGRCNELVGEIPDEIGYLSFLRVLDLCWTRICRVPSTINMLSCLSTLDLTRCDEIIELPELPMSLVCLRVQSRSLQVVPNLSKLTNLGELVLSDGSEGRDSSNLKHACDLGWIGGLSKLKKLKLCLFNIITPPTELGRLSLLEDLTLFGLDLQPLEQLPPSLLSLVLDNFSLRPQYNLKIPSNLTLRVSRLQEIQLNEFSQLQHLRLDECRLKRLSIPSSLRTLIVLHCPNIIEIQFLGMWASLEELKFIECRSIGRMVLCGEGGSLGVLDQSESSLSKSNDCSLGVHLLPNALKKLERLELLFCKNLLEIQVIGTLLSLQEIFLQKCEAVEKLTGISNLKKLHNLTIYWCAKLWVVEGLDELEFLTQLSISSCPSLKTLLDISNSKIPDECQIWINKCGELIASRHGNPISFKHYKQMMAQQGAPKPETNKETKMKGDAEEPDTELQSPFHSCASSWDREISEEPHFDNVREGTLSPFHSCASSWDLEISEEPHFDNVNNVREGTLSPFHSCASSWDHETSEEPHFDNVREMTARKAKSDNGARLRS